MDIKDVYKFVNDIWQFYKEHADVKDTDDYWAGVVADAEILEQRYGRRDEHLHRIILDTLDALDAKGRKKNEQLQNQGNH